MVDGRSVLAIVPARGGSKGIPRKNVREFLGKPLIAWTLDAARESGVLDWVIVSTDDPEIAETGKKFGAEVPFLRPEDLGGDAVPTAPVVQHARAFLLDREGLDPDLVAVLEPTSPTRRPFHIREGLALLVRSGVDSLASVSEVPHHYNPLKILRRNESGLIRGADGTPIRDMIHRRQDLPACFAFNGLIFACVASVLDKRPPTLWGEKVEGYVTDPKYNVDLDAEEDWAAGEARLRDILKEGKDV